MKTNDLSAFEEQQKDICEKYGLPIHPPEAMVAIALDTLQKTPIYGSRIELPENGTISWFIHGGEYSAVSGFYQALHTDHLLEELPVVLKYLSLPEGARFIIDKEGYEDVWMSDQSSET